MTPADGPYEPRPGASFGINIPNWDVTGASNLFTTTGDLLKWEQHLVDGRVGGKARVDAMQASGYLNDGSATGYGFGLRIESYRSVRTAFVRAASGEVTGLTNSDGRTRGVAFVRVNPLP